MPLKIFWLPGHSLVFLIYAAVYLGTACLSFLPIGDEVHYWKTVVSFSAGWIPSLELLRSYPEMNTPLPFWAFGIVERLTHAGVYGGRLVNWILSLSIALLILRSARDKASRPELCVLGLCLCPYYLGSSVLLYTDIMACFFTVLGFYLYRNERHLQSAAAFILALSCRQYVVAFPAAVAVCELLRQGRWVWEPRRQWLAPAVACASLACWYLVFGSLAPQPAYKAWAFDRVLEFLPRQSLYALTCVGIYYVAVEALLFGPRQLMSLCSTRRVVAIAAALAVLFFIFPPLGNIHRPKSFWVMGFFDRFAGALMPVEPRIALYWFLAVLAVLRFSRISLDALCVYFYSLLMTRAYFSWEKYALPLLAVLWFLKADANATIKPSAR